MEPTKFDDLTKALATATSRRQALKTIAATTLGSILGLSGIGTAFAKTCEPNGHNCSYDKQCCSGLCHNHTCVAPPGIQYSCHCLDGTGLVPCGPAPCSLANEELACAQACLSHGGFNSATCNPTAFC
jgi:hypothetical protein